MSHSSSRPRYDVELTYDVRVPMPDGVDLLGNLYRPAGDDAPSACPAILTLIPYQKDGRGGLGMLDAYHRHFAARGYAVLHLDIRGTGSSEGSIMRTLDGRERHDGHHAVEWMAVQPWCTGDVGIWGISYGGITSMAIAETAPPHLRAIVPIHAPSDNYESMVVHRDARLMFWPDPHWGAGMAASNLMPPLRASAGEGWLRQWEERISADPWIFDWYGDFPDPGHWERQRVDASRIQVPSLVICGWQDAYPDSVHALWPLIQAPKRLLLGPWKHVMPEFSVREPIDTLSLIDRWWDRWLKGEENGVESEPPVTIFVQGEEGWRQESEWPPARATDRTLWLDAGGGLGEQVASGGWSPYAYDARVGLGALPYDACTGPIPYPQDQSFDDHLSLTYTTDPLPEPLEITGVATVRLVVATDAPIEEIVLSAKLCDIDPSGQSLLIAFEHESGKRASPLDEGDGRHAWVVEFVLRPTSYVLKAGHRLRLSVAGGNFPYLWPTPFVYRMDVLSGGETGSWIRIPVVPDQSPRLPAPVIDPPPALVPAGRVRNADHYWIHREVTSRAVSFEGRRENVVAVEPGSTLSILQHFTMSVDADHPSLANTRTNAVWRLERPTSSTETRVTTITTLHGVHVAAEIDVDGMPYARKTWRKTRDPGHRTG